MASTVQLDPATELRLDDIDDSYLVAAVAERIRLGKVSPYSLDEVGSELGLDPSTF
jgi:predicted DNA-binding protein